jgi:tetratricopeptide (TPR) repeat protein
MNSPSPTLEPFDRGLALLALRDHLEEAEAAFRAGLALEPNHVGCLLHLGITLRVQGRWKEAATLLLRARELCPRDPVVHMQLGTLLRRQKQPEAALQAYDAALAVDPDHAPSRINRAITLEEMYRLGEALASYDCLIAELPANWTRDYGLVAHRAAVAGRLERIAGMGVDPTLAPQAMAVALYQRANELVLADAADAALPLYEEAALLRPDYADPAFRIGETVAAQLARHPNRPYPSCRWIEEGLHFHEYKLGFCCTSHTVDKGWASVGTYHGGPVPVDYVLARRNRLIRENTAGVENECLGCPELERRAWPARPRPFSILILNSHSACNQKCDYCFLAIAHFEMPAYYYMAEPGVDSLLANDWLAPDAYVLWGGGEPTVSREFPSLAAKLFATGCRFNIYSNATRAMPVLLEALRQGRCHFVTSIDSGTPETFYRIKYQSDHPVEIQGRPAYEVVWDTIGQYAAAGPDTVVVKYIFTLKNLAEEEITGFIARCVAHKVTRILLVAEFCDVFGGAVPAPIWDAIERTKSLAHAKGITVLYNPLYFKAGNMPAEQMEALLRPPSVAPARPNGLEEYTGLLQLSVSPPPEPAAPEGAS